MKITERRDKPLTFRVNGDNLWGNSVCLSGEWTADREPGHQDFYGWKPERPLIGDFIEVEMKSGRIAVFEVIEVKHEEDPADMFFATGKAVEYVDAIPDYRPVYEPYAGKFIDLPPWKIGTKGVVGKK